MKRSLLAIALMIAGTLTVASVALSRSGPGDDGPKVGDKAPDFGLPWATAEAIHFRDALKLSDQKGSNVILAFYPADWSGGCTTEVCTFRDGWGDLAKLNAKLFAISGDFVFSHKEWASHHKLAFPLLSDHDQAVAKAYGSFNAASGFDNRTVYLIDKQGIVRYKNLKFDAGNKAHYDELRAELAKLQ